LNRYCYGTVDTSGHVAAAAAGVRALRHVGPHFTQGALYTQGLYFSSVAR